jgi:UDP-N-acetylglucosamine:LPS N-acetylglucosamine transferase
MKEPKRKVVVGFASILAGGGHNALRDFLYQEFENNPDYELHKFTHSDSSYNFFNDQIFGRFNRLYTLFYNYVPNEYPAISALTLVKECEAFIKKINPDIVISTNFGVSSAIGLIQKTLKLNFINIYAVPDYGAPTKVTVPSNRYIKPDYVIVFDDATRKAIMKMLAFPKEKVLISGYVAKKECRELIKANRKKTPAELVGEIRKLMPTPEIQSIDPTKRTMIVIGGAGGIIHKSRPLLKKIAEYQKSHPEFIEHNQFLVITGLSESFFKKLKKLRTKPEWSNIIPIPWVDPQVYVRLQILAEFPILVTIAPATINELVEARCGPFLIFHSRAGQEVPIVNFAVKMNFAQYLPKADRAMDKIVSGFSKAEKERFHTSSEQYTSERLATAQKLPDVICELYKRHFDIVRKKKRRMKLDFDFSKVSPKLLISIFIMLLPSSLIFAYAQYYKQKNKIVGNRYWEAMVKQLSRFKPF